MRYVNEYASKQMLKEYGIPFGEFSLATSPRHAKELAETYEVPLVMKIVSDEIIHKTEAGGIRLNVETPADAEAVYGQLVENGKKYNPKANIQGVLLAPMVPSGVEVIVGGIRDGQFGPVVMFGLGGIFVEIFQDVQFRMAPLNHKEALKLIRSIKAFPMLDGVRGAQPANLDGLAQILVDTGNFLVGHPEIKEIDLNPVMCFNNTVQALDAVISLDE